MIVLTNVYLDAHGFYRFQRIIVRIRISGESTDDKNNKKIEIMSYQYGANKEASNPCGMGGAFVDRVD